MVQLNKNQAFQQSNPQPGFQQANQDQFQSNQQSRAPFTEQPAQKQGLISLPPALLQIIPWIPFALEAMTGQKIPQMGGTIAEIQASLSQIQFSLSQLLNQQQQLLTRLNSLENNASNQLTNLSQQVASTNQAFRLMHQKETKSLEFNPRPQPELERNYKETEY